MTEAGSRPVSHAPLDLSTARDVLAVRLDNIGDVVMTGPALRAIRAAAPRARLTMLCSPAGRQAAGLLPEIDEVIEARVAWQDVGERLPLDPARELALIERLAASEFEAAFIFTSFSQSPFPPAFACYLAGIPIRVGQAADFGGSLLNVVVPPPPDGAHQVDRNLRVVEGAGLPFADAGLRVRIAPTAVAAARDLLAAVDVDPDRPFVALAPGASARARRYPVRRFAAVAALLRERLGWPIVIVGGPADVAAAGEISAAASGVRSLAGATTVAEWAAIIEAARLLVTSHSAPLHLADAVGTPLVCLFSGTDRESEWRPRSVAAVLLREPTACAPCRLFDCPIGLPCLDIAPERVADAAVALASRAAGAAVPPSSRRPRVPEPVERWTVSAS